MLFINVYSIYQPYPISHIFAQWFSAFIRVGCEMVHSFHLIDIFIKISRMKYRIPKKPFILPKKSIACWTCWKKKVFKDRVDLNVNFTYLKYDARNRSTEDDGYKQKKRKKIKIQTENQVKHILMQWNLFIIAVSQTYHSKQTWI